MHLIATLVSLVLPGLQRRAPLRDRDFDFVEIGTSNFETLLQESGNEAMGLSVDALSLYLDQLPWRTNVQKVHAAIVDEAQRDALEPRVFYIDPSDIKRYRLEWWLKGCNKVGKPHPKAMHSLQTRQLDHLMRNASVAMMTFADLCRVHRVRSIGVLKVDVEGFEANVLRNMMAAAAEEPQLWPRVIKYEIAHLPATEALSLDRQLKDHRYVLITNTHVKASADPYNRVYVRL